MNRQKDDIDGQRLVSDWITEAYVAEASDLHIETQKDELRVRMRVDGTLRVIARRRVADAATVLAVLKVMAGLKVNERRLPQDGRFAFEHRRVSGLDIRLNVSPTLHGEKAVLRLIDNTKLRRNLDAVGFSPANLRRYREAISKPHGLVLHVGPTGSGKTTTLYSAVQELNDPSKNIHTVEDPVEYTLDGIGQTPVHTEYGLTFPLVLRALLRQDPDIIMIGEIRDLETAEIAVEAAMTGHLIFSTLHTNDALGTLARLREMGIADYHLSHALNAVASQRFCRRICRCATPEQPTAELQRLLPLQPRATYLAPRGCNRCRDEGYRGRTLIMELLTLDENLRRVIANGASGHELRVAALRAGMIPLVEDAVQKAADGETSLAEVLRATGGREEDDEPEPTRSAPAPARPAGRPTAPPEPLRRPTEAPRTSVKESQSGRVIVRKGDRRDRRVVRRPEGGDRA